MSDNRLLCVDDEIEICDIISAAAIDCDYEVLAVTHTQKFKDSFEIFKPTLIILDLNLAGEDGIQLLHFLHGQNFKDPVILLSGYDEKVLLTAKLLGLSLGLSVSDTLHKPMKLAQLTELLQAYKNTIVEINLERLKKALINEEFVVYFQPQISLKNGQLIGVEALARWQPPKQALIYPDQFIPLIEQSDLIKPFTDFVMKAAFQQANVWKNEGRDLMVSVNISAKYLDDFAIPEQLLSLATQFDIQPNRVYLEITESSLLDKTKLSLEVLTRLRIKNFNLSMDDFGTGYSSMLSLHQMPFNQIKIDKSFILKIENDPGLQTIARNLIKLFKELKIETVAEGIETKAALDLLYGYSCDIGQGYYISRPLSVERFDDWAKTYSPSI